MKATINGITIEGTPQEIMEYQRLQAEKAQMKPKSPSIDTDWIKGLPQISSVTVQKQRCNHPCFCSGACEGRPAETQRKYMSDYNNVSADRFKDIVCMN